MKPIATVIIPTFNRQELTVRAIKSVINCDGSKNVEIIVIDDCSEHPFSTTVLRPIDSIYRNETNMGANKCRSIGLLKAKGEIIYLLDSDDYLVWKDFEADYKIVKDSNTLFYCAHDYGFPYSIKKLPIEIKKEFYFDYIFHLYPGIANTCCLCFPSNLNLTFDSTLTQHQDWDFVNSALNKNIAVKKIEGFVYIDRTDKKSLGRKKNYKKPLPWIEKLKKEENKDTFKYVNFCILCKYTEHMSFFVFLKQSIMYLLKNKISLIFVCKRFIQRYL